MRIVAYRKGLRKECTMSFTCTVSSVLLPKVSAWLNRNLFSLYVSQSQPMTSWTILPSNRNIEDSLCLSLGCYSIVDLQEESVQNNCTTLEQKTSVARSHWPQRGGLSMNVKFKNGQEDLPLSPPFQVSASLVLTELLKTTTFPGHPGWPCGRLPVLVCWKKHHQAQANYGYEPVYFCAPLTQSHSSTASGGRQKATEGQGMARVGSSCVNVFWYSVETHSSNLNDNSCFAWVCLHFAATNRIVLIL